MRVAKHRLSRLLSASDMIDDPWWRVGGNGDGDGRSILYVDHLNMDDPIMVTLPHCGVRDGRGDGGSYGAQSGCGNDPRSQQPFEEVDVVSLLAGLKDER